MHQFETSIIPANGQLLEVLKCGEGDRLALLLHGFPEHALSWRHQMPVLADMGWRVWAPNQRGYGASSKPPAVQDYAMTHLLADVAALIDAAGARETVLIGHDWGGVVAWRFAASRRRPLRRVVVLNAPHPARFAQLLRSSASQMRKSWYLAYFRIPLVPEWALTRNGGQAVRDLFLKTSNDPSRFDPEFLDACAKNIAEPGAATAMLNWYRATPLRALFGSSAEVERPIETPVLLIWGEDDVALDNANAEGLDPYARNLEVRRLPGVSHWVQQEAPEKVNALLREFLS